MKLPRRGFRVGTASAASRGLIEDDHAEMIDRTGIAALEASPQNLPALDSVVADPDAHSRSWSETSSGAPSPCAER